MTKVEIKPTTEEDVVYLIENMRQADRDEIEVSYGDSRVEDIVRYSVKESREPMSGFGDGELVCIFGVVDVSLVERIGVPWMLTTDAIDKYQRLFLLNNRRYVRKWREQYKYLYNHVDVRNETAIKWLKWLGFDIHDAEPFGPYGAPFYKFDMEVA